MRPDRRRKLAALARLVVYALKVRGPNHPHTINIRRFADGYLKHNAAMCERAMRDMRAAGQRVRGMP